jgi:O-antigen ligase
MPRFFKQNANAGKLALGAVAVAAIAVLFIPRVPSAVADTARMAAHASQERSADGRLAIAGAALHVLREGKAVGAGVGNYALVVRGRGLTSPQMLTAHPFNTLLEIGIEQGVLGVVAVAIIVWSMVKIAIRRRHTGAGFVLLCGVVAIGLYGMGQTYVIADSATAVLLSAFTAVCLRDEDNNAYVG